MQLDDIHNPEPDWEKMAPEQIEGSRSTAWLDDSVQISSELRARLIALRAEVHAWHT